jgi:hypothetical protein
MRITDEALERIEQSSVSGKTLARIFEQLEAASVDANGIGSCVTLDFQHPDDKVQSGDMIPVITLALRPATIQ